MWLRIETIQTIGTTFSPVIRLSIYIPTCYLATYFVVTDGMLAFVHLARTAWRAGVARAGVLARAHQRHWSVPDQAFFSFFFFFFFFLFFFFWILCPRHNISHQLFRTFGLGVASWCTILPTCIIIPKNTLAVTEQVMYLIISHIHRYLSIVTRDYLRTQVHASLMHVRACKA